MVNFSSTCMYSTLPVPGLHNDVISDDQHSAPQQPQMPNPPTNPTSKALHRLKKLKKSKKPKRSPYFPPPPPVPEKSPYFKKPSRRSRGAKPIPNLQANHGPAENQLAVNDVWFLSQTANDQNDGWLTERESCGYRGRPKARRRTRKDCERRSVKKAQSQLKPSGDGTNVDDVRKPVAVGLPSLRTDKAEQLSMVKKSGVAWGGKEDGERTGTLATDILSYKTRQPKKRKRISTFEIIIACPTKSPAAPLPSATLDIPAALPEGGGLEHRKLSGNKRKRSRTTNESPTAEDTGSPKIITGGVDARQEVESLKHKNSPEATTYPQAVIARKKEQPSPNSNAQTAKGNLPTEDKPLAKHRGKRTPATSPKRTLLQSITIPGFSAPVCESVELRPEKVDQVPDSATEPRAKLPRKRARKRIKKTDTVSSYFTSSATQGTGKHKKASTKKRVPAGTSIIPWPRLTAETFGLVQEELRGDSFHVIIATIFLNKTRAATAIPLLRQFLTDYPTPLALSQGNLQTITAFLQPLGLHRTRADRLIKLGQTWLAQPPAPGSGATKYNYPARDTKPFHTPFTWPALGVEQNCVWEIAHLPGVGAYALDSWRIFCLDGFRGVGDAEWRRVVPKDKELRAYLRWRWAKEGVMWREVGDVEVEIQSEVNIGGKSMGTVSE